MTSYTEGGSNEQAWELDALGNWSTFTYQNSTTQITQVRTHNAANELQTISNWAPRNDADAAGNMTSIPNPKSPSKTMSLVFDAWNRLVKVDTSVYRYDGLNRRIVKDLAGDVVEHHYYNRKWQCLETRNTEAGKEKKAFVWHPFYVDALARRYSNGGSHCALQDANFNVIALVNQLGNVVERYLYTAHGVRSVLSEDFSVSDGNASRLDLRVAYSGREFDEESGLYQLRRRSYAPHLGRFISRDPISFRGGDTNLYRYVRNQPTNRTDPSGLLTSTQILIFQAFCSRYNVSDDPMFSHYYYGGGADFDLDAHGLLDDFINDPDVQEDIGNFKDGLLALAEDWASQLECSNYPGEPDAYQAFSTSSQISYEFGLEDLREPFTDPLFPLGGGSMTASASCVVTLTSCDPCCQSSFWNILWPNDYQYHLECDIDFEINDAFTDPWDVLDLFGGNVDAPSPTWAQACFGAPAGAGTPFDIVGEWSDSLNTAFTLPCPN